MRASIYKLIKTKWSTPLGISFNAVNMSIFNDLSLLLFETAKVSLAVLVVRNRLLYDASYTETVCFLLEAIQNVYVSKLFSHLSWI